MQISQKIGLVFAAVALSLCAAADVCAQISMGGTYYVRTTGSNGNTGLSTDRAWRTILYAMQQASPGDTIYVGAGEYSEYLDVDKAADGTKVLRVIGDTGGARTGDAGTITVRRSGTVVRMEGTGRVLFSNMTFDGSNSGDLIWITNSDETVFDNCQLINIGDDGVESRSGAKVVLRSTDVIGSNDDAVVADSASVVLEGCLIDNPGGEGVYTRNTNSTAEIRRTRIVSAGSYGVYLRGDGVLVNCAVVGSTKDGIKVNNNVDAEIVNCTIAYNGHHGVQFSNQCVIRLHNNVIAHSGKNGLKGNYHSSSTHSDNIVWASTQGDVSGGVSLDATDRTVDPLLTSSTVPRLGAGSPAISTAMDASSWTTLDIDGRARPHLGGWDLGAYEFDPDSGALFADVTGSVGFGIELTSNYAMYDAGLHWGDVDNDGDLDCFATGSNAHLFVNDGDGSFVSYAFSTDPSRQGALVDLDNDGDLDYWGGRNLYYEGYFENNGVGGFTYEGHAGFWEVYATDGLISNDFDGDGWCDLAVMGTVKRWFVTNGGVTPVELTGDSGSARGLDSSPASGDHASSGDVNGDGRLDFLHHSGTGKLFLSDGDGTFTLASSTGISESAGGSYDKRGSAWGDYDNDGDLDLLYCAENSGDRVRLYRNDVDWDAGTGTFVEVGHTAGLTATGVQRGCSWGDFDNDGDLDLVIAVDGGADLIYANQGAPSYSFELLDGEPVSSGKGNDIVFVDVDNDGDLDIAVSNEDGPAALLRNGTNDENFLKVRVVGRGAGGTPVSANGVKVELYEQDGTTYLGQRTIFAARGYGGTTPQWAHFGIADPAASYVVKVYFNRSLVAERAVTPNAVSSLIGGTAVSQMVTIDENDFGAARPRVVRWEEVAPVE